MLLIYLQSIWLIMNLSINKIHITVMRSLFFIVICTFFSINTVISQELDEEIGFIYVKAEYLYNTSRYDEAIVEFTKVINKDINYKEALMYRSLSNFAAGHNNEAKSDAMKSIELHGIQATSAAILGRISADSDDYQAAANNMTAAIALDDTNADYFFWRGSYLESSGRLTQACQDYAKANAKGNAEAATKVKSLCGGVKSSGHNQSDKVVTNTPEPGNPPVQNTEQTNQTENGNVVDNSTNSDNVHIDDSEVNVQEENIPKEDNTVNSFVIDDDLSIDISGQELGHRKINEIPSILILSDELGKVTVNICVNRTGVVTKAEFNAALSTITQKSLVALALRKAKEFEFATGNYDAQCGIMTFNIKGK